MSGASGAVVLIIDEDRRTAEGLGRELAARGYAPELAADGTRVADVLSSAAVEAVIVDLGASDLSRLALCERISQNRPQLPVIATTVFGSVESAIAALRVGVVDLMIKPFATDQLVAALERAIRQRRLRAEVERLRGLPSDHAAFESIFGESEPVRHMVEALGRAAADDSVVLLVGEHGTGKETAARAIHARSRRRGGPFLAVNCASFFSGALEQARGGTVFLDEIAELPPHVLPEVAEALQRLDARVIAGTTLEHGTGGRPEDRLLWRDLPARVGFTEIRVPPLRARGFDVLLLAQHFIRSLAAASARRVVGLTDGAAERLIAYPWSGNVRELASCMERAVACARLDVISVDDLPEYIRSAPSPRPTISATAGDPSSLPPLHEVERRYILQVMAAVRGNKRRASRVLQLDIKTLRRKLERYGFARAVRPSERAN